MSMNFDMENTRRELIAMRVRHGAETPIGHRCSNLIELLQNYAQAVTADQEAEIAKLISKQMTELADLEARNKAQGE